MRRVILAIFLALLSFSMPVQAFSRIPSGATIAVIDLGFMGEDVASDTQSRADMAKVATEYITFHLTRQTQLVVWRPEDIAYALEEKALALTGGLEESKAVEVGRAMHADYILCGNILGFGVDRSNISTVGINVDQVKATTKLGLKLIDARTGSVLASAIRDGVSAASGGDTSLPMLIEAFMKVQLPANVYLWNNQIINGELVENSIERAANLAVDKLLKDLGILQPKKDDD